LSAMPPNIAGLPPPPTNAPRSPADIITSMLLRIREGQSYSSDHQDKIKFCFFINGIIQINESFFNCIIILRQTQVLKMK
jgi:hypothetical protein